MANPMEMTAATGASSQPATSVGPERISYLGAEWINARINNVLDRATEMMERIISGGLLSSGYLPFEQPLTPEMLARMTPEQFTAYFNSLPTLGQKSQLLEQVKDLKLPPHVLMPRQYTPGPTGLPAPPSFDAEIARSVQS